MLKCYASGGRGKSATNKTVSRARNTVQRAPTRGRSGLSNSRMNYYKKLWNNDKIGVRTMISNMQSEGASRSQISQAIRWK